VVSEQYGFHILSRQTVFRADGNEHSYYTLPDNYPLELASPKPVFDVYDDESDGCSIDSAQVFTGSLEKLADEEEQHENLQASKCFGKPIFSPERPIVGIVGLFSLIDQKKPHNELAVVCVNKGLDNSFSEDVTDVTSTHFLKPAHGNKLQKEWDPGTVKPRMDVLAVDKWSSWEGTSTSLQSSKAYFCNQGWTYGTSTDLGLTFSDKVANACFSTVRLVNQLYYTQGYGPENSKTVQWDPGVKIPLYNWLDIFTVWNESDRPLSCPHIPDLQVWPKQAISSVIEPATWQSQVTSASYEWDTGSMLLQYESICLLLFIEEKEKVTLVPKQWIFWCNAIHYSQIFQRFTTMSSLFHCHGIPIWLINFEVS
jgi:hypothetical protein